MLEKIKNNKITFIVTGILLVLFGIGLSMSPEYSVSPSQDVPSQEAVVNNEYGFKEITMADALSTWRDNKSAVIVFGFTACPWCQEAYPVLDKVADEKNVDIFYVRTRDEEGELTYTDEQREELYQYMPDLMTKTDEGLTLYVPVVVSVKDGNTIDGHVGTVDGHDAHERVMTEEEVEKLTAVYSEMLEEFKE